LTSLKSNLLLASPSPTPIASAPRMVNVYFHVIMGSKYEGSITTRQIASQIAVLNADFAGSFRFKLVSVSCTLCCLGKI
jgi:hypothetical protein